MGYLIHMCVCASVYLIVVYASPLPDTNEGKPPTKKVIEGDNLLIVCNVTKQPDIDVFWTKNKTGSTFYQDGNKLEFVNINRDDAGDYICHMYNTSLPRDNETESNVTIETVNIDVRYPMDIAQFELGPTEIRENQTFTVSCKVEGNPGPDWEIRNNNTGSAIMSARNIAAGATLTSAPARCQDAGFWVCTGKNKLNHGVNATNGQNLTVLCSPRPNQDIPAIYNVPSVLGINTLFILNVLGYPYPNYTWSRDDGKPLPKRITSVNESWFTALNISNVQITDYTNYSLTMGNTIGSYVAHFQLTPQGHPQKPYNLNFSDVTYDSVRLTWTSGFDMGKPQHFIVMTLHCNSFASISDRIDDDSTTHGIGQKWTYVQTFLDSDTEYKLAVVSEHDDGFMSGFSNSVTFRTKPQPFDPNYTDPEGSHVGIIVGSTVGGLAFLALLASVVYLKNYRNMSTSYDVMKK